MDDLLHEMENDDYDTEYLVMMVDNTATPHERFLDLWVIVTHHSTHGL